MLIKFAWKDGEESFESKVYVTDANKEELQSVINIVKLRRPHSYSIGDIKEELNRNGLIFKENHDEKIYIVKF